MNTVVIFRKFKEGDVLALFPEEPATADGHFCNSYMHVGQHGSASPYFHGRPATPEEYAPLKQELEGLGYSLTIKRRISQRMHNTRRLNAAL